jgi:glycosyltransferase involved in cell wall biosynthesis
MASLAFLIPGDIDLPTGGYIYDRRVMGLLAAHGIETRHVPLPGAYPAPTSEDLAETARLVHELPADAILLIDGLAFGAMTTDLIRQFDRRIIALCHHPLCLEAGLDPDRSEALRISETAALALAKAVLVTSPSTQCLLVRDFAVPASRIVVAVPGTDPAPRSHGSASSGDPIHLLAVGSIVPRKGYDVLVRALETLHRDHWRLAIAGADDRNPGTAAALRAQIKSSGLAGRITLLGALDDSTLSRHYASADIFVMPSLFEGYGMALAEAMIRGLPIVCTTGGAAAETVPDDAAIKVSPGDHDALGRAIERLMADMELRQSMAEAAWIGGLILPRWEDTARIIADVIKKVSS